MKTSSISSQTIQNAMRLTISDAQKQMVDLQKEVTTGEYADVGTQLGAQTSSAVDLTRDSLRLQSLSDANSIADTRLSASQAALDQILSAAQTLQSTYVSIGNNTDNATLTTAQQTATNALNTFTSAANTSANGEYLFSGINTDVKPMADYNAVDSDGNVSSAKQAFDDAFQSYFGMSVNDSATSSITSDQMKDFLENTLEPMFTTDTSGWTDNWSSASDTTVSSRISKTEVVQTSSTANSNGFRYMGLASVIGEEMLSMNLSTDTRSTMVNKAIDYTGKAITGIQNEQTQLGLSQQRIKDANDSLSSQKDIIETQLTSLTGVDAYEASTKLNNLQSLIETSYTLTARLQKLSLVDYLS
ncbi:flagellar hook-associated family protein [Allorhizobium sp. BGMRC 0089]|uniref:flagellar hook-associated family protein n=1 Tax=Allorhizobium sonneratiae TaxID=2934936 RepID=UPI002033D077|nr:flagellar hook-associated family protein [Allorhizobium sonneratiae]MCM2291381.1 flagellar hook-associated family protein [Allorhizobium sonneratiae]